MILVALAIAAMFIYGLSILSKSQDVIDNTPRQATCELQTCEYGGDCEHCPLEAKYEAWLAEELQS